MMMGTDAKGMPSFCVSVMGVIWAVATVLGSTGFLAPATALSLPTPSASGSAGAKIVVLGGTGKIGTAVAAHLSHRLSSPTIRRQHPVPDNCEIVLVGRQPPSEDGTDNESFRGALREIEELLDLSSPTGDSDPSLRPKITYEWVPDIWEPGAVDSVLLGGSGPPVSCVVHTAGPYADRPGPTVLDSCIDFKIPVYVDVSDPVDFLEDSLKRHDSAVAAGTTAVLAAGAFPGMSNVLALEAAEAAAAKRSGDGASQATTTVRDVRFNYFTKGLGGSGTINLYITNIGFGDPMIVHDRGQRTRFDDLSGRLLGTVDFFLREDDVVEAPRRKDNARARDRVGTQKVFAWPFPEAATVASELSIAGSSSAAMGTAPDLWNDMLGLLVDLVPRPWWRSRGFSKFLADFSEPLVLATDLAMRKLSGGGPGDGGDCGETHAMRVDVVTETRDEATGEATESLVSIVQCHDSFRRCVGQSCAEFTLDAWFEHLDNRPKTGVCLPEQRYRGADDRERIVPRITSTPGTFCYTGPVEVASRTVPPGGASGDDDAAAGDAAPDRIFLKTTPTPGLICNGAPMEIRLERGDGDGDNDESGTPPGPSPPDGDRPPRNAPKLPVFPTEVRDIVRALRDRPR